MEENQTSNKRILVLVSSKNFWLAELTHPYWHFSERGCEIDIASPLGGKITMDPTSDPYSETSWEKNDIVSMGFLSDKKLVGRLNSTLKISDVDFSKYDGVHVVGGAGPCFDMYPNQEVANLLENFSKANKIIGTICHGSIVLANIPRIMKGKRATGFSRVEDAQVEELYGANFIPYFPQIEMEKAGINFRKTDPWGINVQIDGNIISGQNQQSASEYAIAYTHILFGKNPVQDR